MLTVYIGYDNRELQAYEVAKWSILSRASIPVDVQPLKINDLERKGLIYRLTLKMDGQFLDVPSDAPASTEFAISRFLVPVIHQTGWAMFMDCDMVVNADIADLIPLLDEKKAVMCVKHNHQPSESAKMDGQVQTSYSRKNWSSVMVFNCDHPANSLSLREVNEIPGRYLHRFCWLEDDDIGELPAGWNWLVGVQDQPEDWSIAHFTLGGPWFEDWKGGDFDEIWLDEYKAYNDNCAIG